jgi:hypothetical protein
VGTEELLRVLIEADRNRVAAQAADATKPWRISRSHGLHFGGGGPSHALTATLTLGRGMASPTRSGDLHGVFEPAGGLLGNRHDAVPVECRGDTGDVGTMRCTNLDTIACVQYAHGE